MAHGALKIVRALTECAIAGYIIRSNLYSKYQELKADDGIPNKKKLLEKRFEFHMQYHNSILTAIDDIKSSSWKEIINRSQAHRAILTTPETCAIKILPKKLFNIPLITNLMFNARSTHPCDLQRALRFKKRIEQIDQQTSQSTTYSANH